MFNKIKYLEVDVIPRYWEDASINGVEDTEDGDMIPHKYYDEKDKSDAWRVFIDLDTGQILDWPINTELDIHYKVCDRGLYWLNDGSKNKLYKFKGHYVPSFLNKGNTDYIIFKTDPEGKILNWIGRNNIEKDEWNLLK